MKIWKKWLRVVKSGKKLGKVGKSSEKLGSGQKVVKSPHFSREKWGK